MTKLVKATCPNCGAPLKVDPSKDAAICEFCNTPFIVDKAINLTMINSGNKTFNVNFNTNYAGIALIMAVLVTALIVMMLIL